MSPQAVLRSPSIPLREFEPIAPVHLTAVEDIFWRLEDHCVGSFRVALVFRLDGWIEPDLLQEALRQLQARHPKLRAVIAPGSDGRRRFQFDAMAPPIPFEMRDYDGSEAPWREETRRLLQIRFPQRGPLAAVTVLRNRARGCAELLITVHHAVADGLSAIILVHDLLTEYAVAEAGSDAGERPVLGAVTARRAVSAGWRSALHVARRVLRLQAEERRLRWTALPESPDVQPLSQWVHWVFPREATLRLVKRCRQEQSSLTGAMVAAVCCGLMECLGTSDGLFKCQFPFDLREKLESDGRRVTVEDLGCFVSIMNEFYPVAGRPVFWDVARRAHQDLHAFVKQGGPSFYYNLASVFGRLAAFASAANRIFARAAPRHAEPTLKRATLLATNYGVPNIADAYGSLRPRECTLMFRNDAAGPSLVMEALVMGQRLNIGFAGDSLQPALWEQLHAAVRRHLDTAASSERNP